MMREQNGARLASDAALLLLSGVALPVCHVPNHGVFGDGAIALASVGPRSPVATAVESASRRAKSEPLTRIMVPSRAPPNDPLELDAAARGQASCSYVMSLDSKDASHVSDSLRADCVESDFDVFP